MSYEDLETCLILEDVEVGREGLCSVLCHTLVMNWSREGWWCHCMRSKSRKWTEGFLVWGFLT